MMGAAAAGGRPLEASMSPSSAAERVASRIHTFGTFAFDSGSLELTRDGRRVALEPQ